MSNIDFYSMALELKMNPIEFLKLLNNQAIQAAYDEGYKDGYCDARYEGDEQ